MDEEPKRMLVKLKLPRKLVNRLDRIARERGIRRSRLIASLLADWVEYYVEDRFEPFSMRLDRVGVIDKLLGEIVVVRMIRGEPYCDYCKSFICGHARYVKKLYSRKKRKILMDEADLGDDSG
ncbi:MAG TPA: hypothetical protein ENF33_04845 [Nitrososphaeria archaeon]|nr:MAG: hypothetical protein DRN68_00300 [Nitrososphaerota archaeon]HDJ67017.1 hypothetical protein [Nitrososphaeria archaeon]